MAAAPAVRRFDSPRFRRRLRWLGVTVVLAAVLAGVALSLPEHGDPPVAHATSNAPSAVYNPPRSVSVGLRERTAAGKVLLTFVQSAVIRRHLALSYDLVTPQLRQGLSRRVWLTGSIPIVPFPVGTDLRGLVLVRSIRGELDYKVSLVPPPGAAAKPAVYDITLRRFHRGWLVDSWAPSYRGLYGPGKLSDASLPIVAPTNPHLRAVWAYAPIGFVALAVLLAPLVLAGRSLLERRRVARTL